MEVICRRITGGSFCLQIPDKEVLDVGAIEMNGVIYTFRSKHTVGTPEFIEVKVYRK